MREFLAISAALHALLLLVPVVLDWLTPTPAPGDLVITEVAFVDGADLDARIAGAPVTPRPGDAVVPGAPP
ncbi:MAG: hypothetical protein ACFBSD_05070, partial [Paracoccaceae bacterium]